AYYAELRAAMSLLAADGIGVFNNRHVIITSDCKCEYLPIATRSNRKRAKLPTHEFVWNALNYWANSIAGINTLERVVRPGGVPLGDWLSQASVGARFVAASWLSQWGLDLQRVCEDQSSRNNASYRPAAFVSAGPSAVEDTLHVLLEFWKLCNPESSG